MRWPWRREAKPIEPRMAADLKVIELQTARRYWRRCSADRRGGGDDSDEAGGEELGQDGQVEGRGARPGPRPGPRPGCGQDVARLDVLGSKMRV
jgi:hypothetical protein